MSEQLKEDIEELVVENTLFLHNRIVYNVKKLIGVIVINNIIFIKIVDKRDNIVDINFNNIVKIEKKDG